MQSLDDQRLLKALLDAALDGIVIADADGIILRTNQVAADLFARTVEALTGANISLLMPEDIAAKHQSYMTHHLQTGEARVLCKRRPVQGMRSDGSTFPLQIALGKAVLDGETAFVATLHDLTHRLAAEEAAARSQRMDALGRMTGGIAHDFNNLLTVVIGNLELLDPELSAGNSEALIADALTAAELGADLTSQLVGFARKRPLNSAMVDLNKAVTSALGLLRHTISARCAMEFSQGQALWPVELDPTQLQTAIFNLALNSQDAMPTGGRIFIETSNIDIDDTYMAQELEVARGRYVRLSVSDTGEGMSPEHRTLALEPFFTTKAIGQGTGLGLSMVYAFTKQSGGHVTLYSEPGQGTTVSLYFPKAEPVSSGERSDPTARTTPRPSGSGKTILVVEDDPRLLRLSRTRLMALGFRCITAPDADTAWTILGEHDDIDLVFTDMVMPGTLSGFDLAQRLAARETKIAVVLTSGFSENVLGSMGPEPSLTILRKPYRQADLAEAIYSALSESKSEG